MTEENSESLTLALPLSKFKPRTSILSLQTYWFTKLTRRLIFSYETLNDCEVKRGWRRSWYPNVALDSQLYNWRNSRKFSLCPPVSSDRRLGPQHLKRKRRVIVQTKHEIMLLGSYLMHSSGILLWGLVASFRAKDLTQYSVQEFSWTFTRVVQKVMPHIFFSETIYSGCMKFTHSITGCLLYTCYFST
jgi:hypothetical protein